MITDADDLTPFLQRIEDSTAPTMKEFGTYTKESAKKVAREFIDLKRIIEQYDLLRRYAGNLEGKKILEVGSGYGLFTAVGNKHMGCVVVGLEPADDIYSETYRFSLDLMKFMGQDPTLIQTGYGEKMPFDDNSFDIVYSSNVLEHVTDPKKVIEESLRVLKPGGTMQMVVPNYGSLWEGHYYIPWIPYLSGRWARVYVRLCGRDTKQIDRIRPINYFWLKSILKPYIKTGQAELLTWGEDVFRERMLTANFTDWAGLKTVKEWVLWAHRLKLIHFFTAIMIACKAQTPLVLTLKKKS